MANQFFEYEGLRIDLSKVKSYIPLSAMYSDPLQVDLGMGSLIVLGQNSSDFIKAYTAYRESLKPKYQFKDGWYWCGFYGVKPSLRYVKDDKSYSDEGSIASSDATKYEVMRPFSPEDVPRGL